jgi:hypothetical protein
VQPSVPTRSFTQSDPIFYSHAVSHGSTKMSLQQVLPTIDAENKRKQAREKSIVIVGLPNSSQQPDTELAQQIISHKLHIASSIASCQRLGQPSLSKTQPVKECLSSQPEAKAILALVKQLWSFTDNYISKNIFINKDLTKLEAESAYYERCRRWIEENNKLYGQTHTAITPTVQ